MITFTIAEIAMWLAGPAIALAFAIRHHIATDHKEHTEIIDKQIQLEEKIDKLSGHLGL